MPDFIEGAQQLARTLPDARYVTIAGAGHLAPLETPEAFERLLREFLGGADGSSGAVCDQDLPNTTGGLISRLRIFPVGPLGSSSRIQTWRGYL